MLLIRNCHLIDPASGTNGVRDILVDGGQICRVACPGEIPSPGEDGRVIDAGGLTAAPGLVDTHVHFRDPGAEYKEDILVGYRWYDTKKIKPLFPFGYGLSYTKFEYEKPEISSNIIKSDDVIEIKCTVKNVGSVTGKEIVQLYIGDEKCSVLRPLKELKDFCKITLKPGESKDVLFSIDKEDLMFFDDKQHEWQAEPGKFKAYIGSSSKDIKWVLEFKMQ